MIELNLPSMTCGHCVRTVTETVGRVDADAQVDVSLERQSLTIESTKPLAEFVAALTDEGYAPA